MEHKRSSSSFIDHDDSETSSENAPDSPLSGVDSRAAATATVTASPNKKSRRGVNKRVVSVPMAEVDGSRSGGSKGDAYPPSDSWAWRKYGQKPIKGSPYPRGYYRCSSSKGCPARKQVERSHANPSMLVITYASDHNHPAPTSKHHNQHNSASTSNPTVAAATSTHAANSSPAPSTPSTNNAAVGEDTNITTSQDNKDLFADPVPDFEMGGDTLLGVGTRSTGDFSWLSDVSFDVPSLVGPRCDDADVAMFPVLREEDESLFADLGELPECSAVFRRGRGMERCKMGPPAPPLCGSTG